MTPDIPSKLYVSAVIRSDFNPYLVWFKVHKTLYVVGF